MKTTDAGYVNKNNQKISAAEGYPKPTITRGFTKWNVLLAAADIWQTVAMFGLENAPNAETQKGEKLFLTKEQKRDK